MNRILPRALVFTFVVGLSSTYVSKTLWACGLPWDLSSGTTFPG